MINHLRMPSWPVALIEELAHLAHFDTFLIATYKAQYKPIVVHSSYELDSQKNIRSFIDKGYLLDPLYNAIEQGAPSGTYRLRDLAPDSFETTEQFMICYSNFDLHDEIIYLARLDEEVSFTVSLGRTSKLGGISRAEFNRLKAVQPVVQAMCQQFWQAQSNQFVHNEQSRGSLAHAISTFGSNILTPREKQITGLVLQGYSSKSIAQQLDISVGTIKVHRKSIYFKLDISSQSELFSLFIDHLRNF